MNKKDTKKINSLYGAIIRLNGAGEAKKFFRDLLTEKELIELGNRWRAAEMLYKKASYSQIISETGLSSRTIARISKWLNKGMGGYKIMLKRIFLHHSPSSEKRLC